MGVEGAGAAGDLARAEPFVGPFGQVLHVARDEILRSGRGERRHRSRHRVSNVAAPHRRAVQVVAAHGEGGAIAAHVRRPAGVDGDLELGGAVGGDLRRGLRSPRGVVARLRELGAHLHRAEMRRVGDGRVHREGAEGVERRAPGEEGGAQWNR